MIGDMLDTDIAFAANCSLGFSLAVLSGVATEQEILDLSKKLNDDTANHEEIKKRLPNFYTESLGTLESFIR